MIRVATWQKGVLNPAKQQIQYLMKFSLKKINLSLVNLLPFASALLIFFLVELGTRYPEITESWYSKGLYPVIASLFSAISGLFPFSLWDIFWALFVLFALFTLGRVILRKLKPGRFLLRTLQVAAILYSFFYLSWGFNYFRLPIENRLHWNRQIDKTDIFPDVLDSLISSANASRIEYPATDYPTIDSLVEASYRDHATAFGYSYPNGSRRAKTMTFTSFFAKSGVSGYFGPFFNEVHLNGKLLPTEYPFVLAHEKAHQFGYSGEAEANFMAWYICNASNDKRLKYSANILGDRFHREAIREYLKRFDKKAMADIMAQRNHWMALRNETLDRAQTTANNAYLKTNKIHEGVMNYNSVVKLTLEWYLTTYPALKSKPSK
jgi:Protein of unknown function (DUF3810)